ncbi:MAG: hypothetical protein ACOYL6_10785 [Bacteriovoracaceae bacterium]
MTIKYALLLMTLSATFATSALSSLTSNTDAYLDVGQWGISVKNTISGLTEYNDVEYCKCPNNDTYLYSGINLINSGYFQVLKKKSLRLTWKERWDGVYSFSFSNSLGKFEFQTLDTTQNEFNGACTRTLDPPPPAPQVRDQVQFKAKLKRLSACPAITSFKALSACNAIAPQLACTTVNGDLSCSTLTGHVFTQVTNRPQLGNAWRDENGLIWSDVKQDEDGSALLVKKSEAIAYCKSIGAQLPTVKQFSSLSVFLGGTGKINDIGENKFVPQILPGLVTDNDKSTWTASDSQNNGNREILFSSSNGYLYSIDTPSDDWLRNVRCVSK